MATLIAMTTVLEKIQMTFPMKLLSQFQYDFIFRIYVKVLQNLAKKVMIEIQDGRHAHIWEKTFKRLLLQNHCAD